MPARGPRSCPPRPRDRAASAGGLSPAPQSAWREAKNPGIFVGWGAVDATRRARRDCGAPRRAGDDDAAGTVGVSGQPSAARGLRLRTGSRAGGRECVSRLRRPLAVGTRFAEIPTGATAASVPANLVHVDINPRVFDANYPATVALEGDARAVLGLLREARGLPAKPHAPPPSRQRSRRTSAPTARNGSHTIRRAA